MINHHLLTAFRHLKRQKGFSLINITGLAVGMACVILVGLYIQDELSYDRYHANVDRLYRLTTCPVEASLPDFVGTPAPLGPALKNQFPEVEDFVRFDPFMGRSKALFQYADQSFYEDRFFLADPSLFHVLSFQLLQGGPATALSRPNHIVISESTALKYFGDEDPMGKTLAYNGEQDFMVAGVMADIPPNSHFTFDLVASFAFINEIKGWSVDVLQSWGHFNFYTYLLLEEGSDPAAFAEKSTPYIQELLGYTERKLFLEPVKDIHLRAKVSRDPEPHGDIMNVYLYATIAVVILIIACINFMNLYTANAERRAREVGIRKVVGAQQKQLAHQILSESFLLVGAAFPLALLLADLALPAFNRIAGKSLGIALPQNLGLIGGLVLMIGVVGLLSGLYPSLYIASLRPIQILRGQRVGGSGSHVLRFRHLLVILQFTVSIVFIVGSFVLRSQMRYLMNKDLGYDRANIINVPMYSSETRDRYETFQQALLRQADVVDVTATSFTPSIERWREGLHFEGRTDTDDHMFYRIAGDFNFIDLLGLKLIAGRGFDRTITTDLIHAWILNESSVREIGWTPQEALGKSFGNAPGKVIGVIQDFNFRSLHQETRPLALNVLPRAFQYAVIKFQPGSMAETVQSIETQWRTVNPGYPFEYTFYDDEFTNLYDSEKRLLTVLEYFSFLAVFVACLGLLGLSVFMAQRRTKEIGIRKVLGARFVEVCLVLISDLLRLVLISTVLAAPIAYFGVERWLQGFTYRIGIGVFPFLISGFVAVAIALATVSTHVIRVARINPTDVLKCE